MKISDLTLEVKEKIKLYLWDGIIGKHEGPEDWDSVFKYDDPEFMQIMGHDVLLPVSRDTHCNITILRCVEGDNGRSLTIFLKDTTYVSNPDDEMFDAGFVAVCDKYPGEDFYIAVLYHEWFIIENS